MSTHAHMKDIKKERKELIIYNLTALIIVPWMFFILHLAEQKNWWNSSFYQNCAVTGLFAAIGTIILLAIWNYSYWKKNNKFKKKHS